MITNAQKINYRYLSLCPLDRVAAKATALFAYMHMQIACSVRVALCTCCALCAIKHMTQKHWCVRAAREREEGVKTHRYAVLKGCRERDIVRPPTLVQITPELPTVTVFIPTLQEIWSDPAKNSAVMTVMTSTPRSHLITAVKRYCGYRHSPNSQCSLITVFYFSLIITRSLSPYSNRFSVLISAIFS